MLRAGFDARGTVGVLALGVHLPRVGYRVVALHGRAFLLAYAIVEKVAARLFNATIGSGYISALRPSIDLFAQTAHRWHSNAPTHNTQTQTHAWLSTQ